MEEHNQPSISCINLEKKYYFYDKLFPGLVHKLFKPGVSNPHLKTVHALKNVNFEVNRGEVFGFLGSNGAGKSSLLACIAGISPFDSGEIRVNGNVEALLKIGVGFHPRFTGRENIMIGLISMGVPVEEANESVEPVLDFAELRDFGDMPYYTYSSGMAARLQFSVAVHRTPEILLLDEALSAGDGVFNSKASRRIEDICGSGTTVLIVTHSVSAVESLCNRALILDRGEVLDTGGAAEIGARYRKLISSSASAANRKYLPEEAGATSDHGVAEASIVESEVQLPVGSDIAIWDEPIELRVKVSLTRAIQSPRFRVDIYDSHTGILATSFGNSMVDHATRQMRFKDLGLLHGTVQLNFSIPALPLGGGKYYWSFSLMPKTSTRMLETENDYLIHRRVMGYFSVESFPDQGYGRTVITETPANVTVTDLTE